MISGIAGLANVTEAFVKKVKKTFVSAMQTQIKKASPGFPGRPNFTVRVTGVEPACLAAPDPKSGTSANFVTPAIIDRHKSVQN